MTAFLVALDAARIALEVLDRAGAKTVDYYRRIIVAAVRALYNDNITLSEFVDRLSTLIYNQLFAAWREGMADAGADPKADFTQEMSDIVSGIADNELQFLRQFGKDIVTARVNETLDGVLMRAEAWANRYNDVRDRARLFMTDDNQHVEWVVGPTEHCDTCRALDGVVATAAAWKELEGRGIYPKSTKLACGGYHCECKRVPTDKPLTKGGLPL